MWGENKNILRHTKLQYVRHYRCIRKNNRKRGTTETDIPILSNIPNKKDSKYSKQMKELHREIYNPTVVAGGTADQVDRKKKAKILKTLQ